jgi:tryptophan synthase alpha chain
MSRIAAAFSGGRKAFIPFLVAGDPDLETSMALVRALAKAGADAIEVGVPFTDPVADGPTIQRAAERALARGATLARTLRALAAVRKELRAPIVLFTYLNPLLALGEAARRDGAIEAACDAALVVDLPIEEAEAYHGDLLPAEVERIFLASPSTSGRRLERLRAGGGPFVYYVSRYGVTGAREELPPDLGPGVRRVREATGRPVAVGFGIARPAQARAVAEIADGVIVGSAIVERIARGGEDLLGDVGGFARELADAVHAAAGSNRETWSEGN